MKTLPLERTEGVRMQGSVAAELGLNPMGPCSLPSSPALKTRGNEAGNSATRSHLPPVADGVTPSFTPPTTAFPFLPGHEEQQARSFLTRAQAPGSNLMLSSENEDTATNSVSKERPCEGRRTAEKGRASTEKEKRPCEPERRLVRAIRGDSNPGGTGWNLKMIRLQQGEPADEGGLRGGQTGAGGEVASQWTGWKRRAKLRTNTQMLMSTQCGQSTAPEWNWAERTRPREERVNFPIAHETSANRGGVKWQSDQASGAVSKLQVSAKIQLTPVSAKFCEDTATPARLSTVSGCLGSTPSRVKCLQETKGRRGYVNNSRLKVTAEDDNPKQGTESAGSAQEEEVKTEIFLMQRNRYNQGAVYQVALSISTGLGIPRSSPSPPQDPLVPVSQSLTHRDGGLQGFLFPPYRGLLLVATGRSLLALKMESLLARKEMDNPRTHKPDPAGQRGQHRHFGGWGRRRPLRWEAFLYGFQTLNWDLVIGSGGGAGWGAGREAGRGRTASRHEGHHDKQACFQLYRGPQTRTPEGALKCPHSRCPRLATSSPSEARALKLSSITSRYKALCVGFRTRPHPRTLQTPVTAKPLLSAQATSSPPGDSVRR
ncbi:hypothetical protein Cadr_000025858 [Camelus dromedarius]|uniref:Uncharacterized protein n=1 Tax=Camelus dromedarius TaxID=9838 RepID=A0A5N4CMD9_CAMDR|nr:hypothetical protein Cadr_000025858 [Camelus dromedarius]